ncbi:MAG: signal recognition particle receptor subunit alpha, partial [Bacteroidetes bacterium]|nr:signal recognition particle receptor subunit alpha [Bacteroidota bacterium]
MGIFNFFNKEKKEQLDEGLKKTKQSFFSKISRVVVGKSRVGVEILDDLEEVLIEADIGFETTVKIIEKLEERVARDKYMNTNELHSILKEEIGSLLAENKVSEIEDFVIPEMEQ